MGTLITEWAEGACDNLRLLDGPTSPASASASAAISLSSSSKLNPFYADRLVQLCCYYGFDGWFINIESDVPPSHVPKMVRHTIKSPLHLWFIRFVCMHVSRLSL
jgi:hypothetical protein